MLGDLISGGMKLLGGWLGQEHQQDMQAQQMAFQREQAARNEALQREFAQSGLQWKVADAKKAGIHPLYAMGAPSISPAVSVGSGPIGTSSPMAAAVGAMGQDISRAINATRPADAREEAFNQTVREMNLQNMALKNDLLMSQIQRMKVNQNPPMPDSSEGDMVTRIGRDKLNPRQRPVMGGTEINTDPGTSDARVFEDRYGETLSDWVFGPYIAWRDFNTHVLEPRSQLFEEKRRRWHGDKFGHGRGGR